MNYQQKYYSIFYPQVYINILYVYNKKFFKNVILFMFGFYDNILLQSFYIQGWFFRDGLYLFKKKKIKRYLNKPF